MKHLLIGLSLVVASACSDDGSSPADPIDGSVPVACSEGQPGLRVNLHFERGVQDPYAWHHDSPGLHVLSAGRSENLDVLESSLDAQGRGSLAIAWPEGWTAGPATTSFDANAGGTFQWTGGPVSFTADPSSCVDVDLPVAYFNIGDGPACRSILTPGLMVIIKVPPGETLGNAELIATYSDGSTQNLTASVPQALDGMVFVRAEYPAEVPAGAATVRFSARPDPGWSGQATVEIDPSACSTAFIQQVTQDGPDAGV